MSTLQELAMAKDWPELRRRVEAGEGASTDSLVLTVVLQSKERELAELLIAKRVGIEPTGAHTPPLTVVAFEHDLELTRQLIDAGAPMSVRTGGFLPIHQAVRSKSPDVLRMIWAAGGMPAENDFTDTAWASALADAGPNLALLAELIGTPHVVSAGGMTLLHFAVLSRSADSVRALLEAGADPAAKTTEKIKNKGRVGLTPLQVAVQMRQQHAPSASPEIEALLEAAAPTASKAKKPMKAKTVVEVPVFEVPDWAGDEPGHIHPGARLLRDPYKQGLYCSYCSTLDPSHVIPFCDVAPQRVDLRLLTIASAYSDHMMNGVDQAAAQSLRKSSATFAKRVADLRPDTRWRGESLTSRSGPETATGLAEDPLLSSPHPFGRSAPDREPEAEIFRAMLACTTAGGDELDLLRDIAASADELRSRAALRLLSMHMPRMPAWFWNPSLPMPEHLIAEADAIHDGARSTPVVLWDLERARKNLDVVLASVADPRWMVAVQAVGALPDPRRSRSLWSSLDADVRSRLVDLLFDWWDRALGEPTPPHQHALSRSLGLLAASMSDTPSPRYLALKQSLAAKSRTQPLQTMAYAEAQSLSS